MLFLTKIQQMSAVSIKFDFNFTALGHIIDIKHFFRKTSFIEWHSRLDCWKHPQNHEDHWNWIPKAAQRKEKSSNKFSLPYQACRNQKSFFFVVYFSYLKISVVTTERMQKSMEYKQLCVPKILGNFFFLGWLTENFQ